MGGEAGNIVYTKVSGQSVQTGNGTYINHNALFNSSGYLSSITIPETVTIEGRSFTVKYIGTRSFSFIYGISEVIIPNTVVTIRKEAFWLCYDLVNLTFAPGSRLKTVEFKFVDGAKVISIYLPGTLE